ncbi:uncharacterized protein GGS22DRAFT_95026 [Annulohypoxylon maeteangense]|uniref:uncharacterized protein n=1 Tax=Annulohypoxylon maeteangense TaxID=1927788 RepID=UPI0020080C60|nr:uncharacterized protein GGS22DRAFT_95026 [Annulohypoxylon maeteangense]KAI0888233.1 hypothetical protein GGS22DRAFT_95026 [Annulohypoxylon maeteangense]
MPIVNGQKMACQPCIRGHRSTKCTHGGDRMLVPVRKPGRPLSTCPHPPGKDCQCRNVTAAIPKGVACRCGGSQGVKPNGTPTLVKAEPSENAPLSPTKQASFRVQKPATKPNRKQSLDASVALQRMDSNNLNLQNGANEYLAQSANGVTSSNWGSFVSPLQNGANPYSTYPSMTSRLEGTMDSSILHINGGLADIAPNLSSGNGISDHSTVSSGTLTPGTSDSPYHTPTSSNGEPSQELSLEPPGSCCSQRMQQPQQVPNRMQFQGHLQSGPRESPNMMGYAPQVTIRNGSMMEQVPTQVTVNQQLYTVNNYAQAGLFSDNLSFGTPQLPLQQAQWEQLMANFMPQAGSNEGGPSYTNHVCDCGPGCECLGCASHPYNQVSIQYVREAMALQESLSNGSLDTPTPIADPPLVGEASPPPTHSPAETESPGANELNLSPSEFLFVDYGSGICGCGDDCACVNCMIHRDPLDHKMTGHGIGGLHDKTPN